MTLFTKRWRPSALLLGELGVFAAFVALSIVMTWPLLPKAASHIADIGIDDQLGVARGIRETLDWVFGNRAGIYDAGFFFPHPAVFATTDPGLGIALLVLPFRLFTDDYLLLANLALLLTFPLTAHATYLLVRDLTRSLAGNGPPLSSQSLGHLPRFIGGVPRAAGFVSGVAFGFCLYRAHQLDHASILQMQWFVYSLVFLHRLHQEPRWGRGALLVFFFVMNAITSASIALFTFAAYPVIGLWALVTVDRANRRRFFTIALASAVVGLIVIAPFYAPFTEARVVYGMTRSVGQAIHWAARVDQFHAAPSSSLLYGASFSKYLGSESAVFLGFSVLAFAALGILGRWVFRQRVAPASASAPAPASATPTASAPAPALWTTIRLVLSLGAAILFIGVAYFSLRKVWLFYVFAGALFLVALVRRRRASANDPLVRLGSAAWLYLFLAILFAAFSLGPLVIHSGKPIGPGPWTFLADVPGFGSVRTPSRLFFVASMGIAILAGIGFASVSSALRGWRSRGVLFVLALAAVLVELWVAPIPTRKVTTLAEAPRVYHWLAAEPGRGAVAELPVGGDERGRIRRAHMYFGNIHRRPTVDDVASFDLPVIFWLNLDAAVGGRLAVNLERLQSAGLDYIVLHRAQIPPQFHRYYYQALTRVAATKAAEFGPDLAFALPKLPAPRPFGVDAVLVALAVPPAVLDGKPLAIDVHLAPRGDYAVFERGVRKLTLHAKISYVKDNPQIKQLVYLAPPLFAAAHRESFKVEIPIDASFRGVASATIWLTDEKGSTWATVSTSLAFADRGAWDAHAPRAPKEIPEGACAVRFVAAHRLGDATRLLLEVRNAGPTPWVASPAAVLKVREFRATPTVALPPEYSFLEEEGPRPEWSVPVPALAPGASVLLDVEIPVRPFAIEAAVHSSVGERPCATTSASVN